MVGSVTKVVGSVTKVRNNEFLIHQSPELA